MCKLLRKRKVDVCFLQEVRRKELGAQFVGNRGRRYKLWWTGNNDGIGGVGILVKEELCQKVVEVRRKSYRDDNSACFLEGSCESDMCLWAPGRKIRMREESIL